MKNFKQYITETNNSVLGNRTIYEFDNLKVSVLENIFYNNFELVVFNQYHEIITDEIFVDDIIITNSQKSLITFLQMIKNYNPNTIYCSILA